MRKKKIEEAHDNDLSLVQLTTGSKITVYNLEKENKYEVTLMPVERDFYSPIIFANTGYTLKTRERTLQTNSMHSLGIERPCN